MESVVKSGIACIDYGVMRYNPFMIKNDVFLNQNNVLTDEVDLEDVTHWSSSKDQMSRRQPTQDAATNSDVFTRIMAHFLAEDDYDSQQLFGCVCCDSCRVESQQFQKKSSHMLHQFKRQVFGLKESVRQQMSDINKEMNDMRLKFAKLLLDLQVKLNQKNYQLERLLDISRVIQQTNNYLLIDNNHLKKKLEKVCKENIQYRNKLGIDLKIVLNRNECNDYLKKQKALKKKRLMENKTNGMNGQTSDGNKKIELSEIKERVKHTIKARMQMEKTNEANTRLISVPVKPIKTSGESPPKFIAIRRGLTSKPLPVPPITTATHQTHPQSQSESPNSTTKPIIIQYDSIPCNPQSTTNSSIKLKELSHFESNSRPINVTKTYSKPIKSPQLVANNWSHMSPLTANQDICRQMIVANVNGYHKKYNSNNFQNHSVNDVNFKKKKLDNFTTGPSLCNGVVIKAEPQTNETLPSLFPKDFAEFKDRNK